MGEPSQLSRAAIPAAFIFGSLVVSFLAGGRPALTWWFLGAWGVAVAWAVHWLLDAINRPVSGWLTSANACPRCEGEGYLEVPIGDGGELYPTPCPACGGTRVVDR